MQYLNEPNDELLSVSALQRTTGIDGYPVDDGKFDWFHPDVYSCSGNFGLLCLALHANTIYMNYRDRERSRITTICMWVPKTTMMMIVLFRLSNFLGAFHIVIGIVSFHINLILLIVNIKWITILKYHLFFGFLWLL